MNSRLFDEFHSLAEFLASKGMIQNAADYRTNLSALTSFARRLKTYFLLAPRREGKRVLDIGCALGHGARILADHARSVTALDSDQKVLETARRLCSGEKIRFVRAGAQHLPCPDRTFGVVTACHLIEHLPPLEVVPFLQETRRVTESGGIIFITTPNRRFRLRPLQRPFNPDHRQEFTARRLRRILCTVFDEVEIMGMRASARIESIERDRVRLSPLRVYLRDPLAAVSARVFPAFHRRFQAALEKSRKSHKKRNTPAAGDFRPEELSLDEYYLDGQYPDQGIDLLAICH